MIKKSKKKIAQINRARMYIQASFNNTIVTISDDKGDVLATSSAGSSGFKGARKATLYAAQITAQNVLEKVKSYGIHDIDIIVSGVGSGRDSAVRSLQGTGINIISIKDKTPLPHNGCRAKKLRRV